MCGIVGVLTTVSKSINQAIYDALIALQHRGQDAAGIMTCDQGRLFLRKGNGLVRDVFDSRHMHRLQGPIGIGHVRYPTAGTDNEEEAQPFYVNSPYGISLAHNGNLTNTSQLAKELFHSDLRHLKTNSDSEALVNVFAHELQCLGKLEVKAEDIFQAVHRVHQRCHGAYAAVVMIIGYGLVAFRDPYGIRPLVYGKRKTMQGIEYMVASESVALDTLGFEFIADVAPGEAVCIDKEGNLQCQQCADYHQLSPCIFEHVYLARPDSMLDQISVYQARVQMGKLLAKKILRLRPDHDIDVVIPIPETSRIAALSLANTLSVDYREGFVKNHYIGRTFIMPKQTQRKKSAQHKLNAVNAEFKDKIVLLIDDSIVRGTTSKEIIQMARKAGARKVYFGSAAPEVRYPNVYGVNMPTREELITHNRNADQVSKFIGADWLIYQDLPDLVKAVQTVGQVPIEQFEMSIFNGDYVTRDINDA